MEKIKSIEAFLKLIAEISKNDIEIDSNLVYSNLISTNVKREKIDHYFEVWPILFQKTKNINVFVAENWKSFCQFVSKDDVPVDEHNIKIYLPLNREHILEGVQQIFAFLSSNNISYCSKVANTTRFDDVVLRVSDLYSLEKIKEFVNENKYIKEGLILPNPFAFTDGNISFAYDGSLSYDMAVSEWISDYINESKLNNRFQYVSYADFCMYLQRRYEEVFKYGININDFSRTRMFVRDEDDLLNYKYITEILLLSISLNSTLKDFYDKIGSINDKEKKKEEVLNLRKLVLKDKKSCVVVSHVQQEIFDYVYIELSKKENPSYAIEVFKRFKDTGNYRYFTRNNNVRRFMLEGAMTPQVVEHIILEEQKNALMNASLETIKKYDSVQLATALFGIKNNNYSGFTNENNARTYLKIMVKPNEIDKVVSSILEENSFISMNIEENYWLFLEIIKKMNDDKVKQ